MKFIILPINDAKVIFSEKELETHRKSIDGSKVIVHEETLLEKRQALGLSELPTDTDSTIQWTYPVYEYNSEELNSLLNSSEWSSETVENVQTSNISISTKTNSTRETTKTTSANIDKSYWNL